MIELLSEFESNASSLLMKYRDHYSHSVYVFALGLAIYETNAEYRRIFADFYSEQIAADDPADEAEAACFFLEYWGLASLFHDIGYPFEIPFEQVMAYFEVDRKKRGLGSGRRRRCRSRMSISTIPGRYSPKAGEAEKQARGVFRFI